MFSSILIISTKKYLKTGLIVKVKNSRSGEIETYVLIRTSDDISKNVDEIDPNVGNAKLVSLSGSAVVPVAIGTFDGAQYGIQINASVGVYEDGGDECGVFEINHMSHKTLVKIICNYHTTTDQT